MRYTIIAILCSLSVIYNLSAQQKVRLYGYILNEENRGIENAKVQIIPNQISTISNQNGFYDINFVAKDSITITFSHLGYEKLSYTIYPKKQVIEITTVLSPNTQQLGEVEIKANRLSTSMMQTIDPKKYQLMPNASGNFESLLLKFSGVSSNNELSSQYNVRGGNFDENIVYVNGIQIYRPILIRAGQQEGLSFINPNMVKNVQFSSGGFNAEYGDKMSSVLDVTYKKPTQFRASTTISLLGASAHVETANKQFTQMHSIRYKTSKYLLGTLDTKGSYQPNFIDYQTYMTYQISPQWSIDFLGNYARNEYNFVPKSKSTSFGTYNAAEKLTVYFDGQEKDIFQTLFGATTLTYKPTRNFNFGITAVAFTTKENETFDISGEYILSEMNLDNGEPKEGKTLGVGTYHQHARNRLNATVLTIAHKASYINEKHTLKWGIDVQKERILDNINEWEWRDSAGYTLPQKKDGVVRLHSNIKSDQFTDSYRTSSYLQDTYRLNSKIGKIAFTGGIRAAYWSLNQELIVSPRISLSLIPKGKRDFDFRFATGLYYQSPFYKEIRRVTTDILGNNIVQLNNKIHSQRSYHFVLGGDYYFRAWGRPLKFTTEAYLKLANNIISYTVDNVRIKYTGTNDAKAYTTGIDFKLFGELVPGTDSWLNFSIMQSKEQLIDYSYTDKQGKAMNPKSIARPNEQRYSISLFFTDYLPNNPKYKLYLKAIYADGLPIAPPNSPRHLSDAFRLRAYKRVDIGASRVLFDEKKTVQKNVWLKHIDNVWLSAEIFNLFDFKNENSIYWVSDIRGVQHGSPNYLTGRQYNIKLIIDIK